MLSSAWVFVKVCGEPVSKRATQSSSTATGPLWILILVVKEESSIVTTPATRQGPCSVSKGGCWLERTVDITARTSPPWSDGTFGRESG